MNKTEKELRKDPVRYSLFREISGISLNDWFLVNLSIIIISAIIVFILSLAISPIITSVLAIIAGVLVNYLIFNSIKTSRRLIDSSVSWILLIQGMEAFGESWTHTTEGNNLLVEAYRETGLLSRTAEDENMLKSRIHQHLENKKEALEELEKMFS